MPCRRYRKMTRPPKIVRPAWITGCVAAGRLVDLGPFLLERAVVDDGQAAMTAFVARKCTQPTAPENTQVSDAAEQACSPRLGRDRGKGFVTSARGGSGEAKLAEGVEEQQQQQPQEEKQQREEEPTAALERPTDIRHGSLSLCSLSISACVRGETSADAAGAAAAHQGDTAKGSSSSMQGNTAAQDSGNCAAFSHEQGKCTMRSREPDVDDKSGAGGHARSGLLRAWQQACCSSAGAGPGGAPQVLPRSPEQGGAVSPGLLAGASDSSAAASEQVQQWIVVVRLPSWWERRQIHGRNSCEPDALAHGARPEHGARDAPGSRAFASTGFDIQWHRGAACQGARGGGAPQGWSSCQAYPDGLHDLSSRLTAALAHCPNDAARRAPPHDDNILWSATRWQLVSADMAVMVIIRSKQGDSSGNGIREKVQQAVEHRLGVSSSGSRSGGAISIQVGDVDLVLPRRPRHSAKQPRPQQLALAQLEQCAITGEHEQQVQRPAPCRALAQARGQGEPASPPIAPSIPQERISGSGRSVGPDAHESCLEAGVRLEHSRDEWACQGRQKKRKSMGESAAASSAGAYVESMSQIAQEDLSALPLDIQAELRLLPNHRPTRHVHTAAVRPKGARGRRGTGQRAFHAPASGQYGIFKGGAQGGGAGISSGGIEASKSLPPPKLNAARAQAQAAGAGAARLEPGVQGRMGAAGADSTVLRELEEQMGVSCLGVGAVVG